MLRLRELRFGEVSEKETVTLMNFGVAVLFYCNEIGITVHWYGSKQ